MDLWETVPKEHFDILGEDFRNIPQIISGEIDNGFGNIRVLEGYMSKGFVQLFEHVVNTLLNKLTVRGYPFCNNMDFKN